MVSPARGLRAGRIDRGADLREGAVGIGAQAVMAAMQTTTMRASMTAYSTRRTGRLRLQEIDQRIDQSFCMILSILRTNEPVTLGRTLPAPRCTGTQDFPTGASLSLSGTAVDRRVPGATLLNVCCCWSPWP